MNIDENINIHHIIYVIIFERSDRHFILSMTEQHLAIRIRPLQLHVISNA